MSSIASGVLVAASALASVTACGSDTGETTGIPVKPFVASTTSPTTDPSPPPSRLAMVSEVVVRTESTVGTVTPSAVGPIVRSRLGDFSFVAPRNWRTFRVGPELDLDLAFDDSIPESIRDSWPILNDDIMMAFAYSRTPINGFVPNVNVLTLGTLPPEAELASDDVLISHVAGELAPFSPLNVTVARIEHPAATRGTGLCVTFDSGSTPGLSFRQLQLPTDAGTLTVTLSSTDLEHIDNDAELIFSTLARV